MKYSLFTTLFPYLQMQGIFDFHDILAADRSSVCPVVVVIANSFLTS